MEAIVLALKVLGIFQAAALAGFSLIDALVQGAATVLAAVIAAWIVIYQVDKSARYSREQLAESERLKLNLSIYSDVIAASDAACEKTAALEGLLLRLQLELDNAERMKAQGRAQTSFRSQSISPAFNAAYASGVQIMRIVERWSILDARLLVFQTAFSVANYDLRTAYYQGLVPLLFRILPDDAPDGLPPQQWTPPDPSEREELDQAVQRLSAAAYTLNLYGMDFQAEMQDLLLKHLGKAEIPRRLPLDPGARVICLDQAEALMASFEATAWAADRREGERLASQAVKARDGENTADSTAVPA